jgi:predicted Zn-dependent protease
MLVSREQETQLGLAAANDILKKEKIDKNPQVVERVRQVGERIAAAADQPSYSWAFYVIDEPQTINAFCLPGGKVFVYTGILPLTTTDAELATVMCHEVATARPPRGGAHVVVLAAEAGGAVAAAASACPTGHGSAFSQAYGRPASSACPAIQAAPRSPRPTRSVWPSWPRPATTPRPP